jgi:hypothetical protein
MTASKAAVFALLSLWGVGAAPHLPAYAEETPTESSAEADGDNLTNRVWVKDGDDDALPGIIKIFLSDGTLVQDSCWETHRLSTWTKDAEAQVTWTEDGMEIKAEFSVSADELVLKIAGIGEERYIPATVPYVCPDMPRS